MGKKLQALLLFLFLSGAAFAGTFSRSFIVDYQALPALAYVNTDVSVAPSVSPAAITMCTGSTFTPTLSLSTAYVAPSYDALLSNDVLVGSYSTCLLPYTTLLQNQMVNWVTSAQYSSLAGTNWYSSPATFQNVVPGMVQSDERSQYMNPLTGAPFVVNGDNRFKARIGMFCTASVELVSSTNPSIYQLITGQYTGQSLTASPITLPGSPGTVQLTQRVNVTHCIASGRTLLNPSCSSYETVWMYHNNTFPLSVSSAPTIITVKNPFTCNLAALSFAPMAMNNSTTYSFSLVLKNNGDSVNITSIALASGSQFSNFQVTSPQQIPPPYTLGAGVQQTFSGTVKSPAATGMIPLTLNINSVSTAPNCTGITANCNIQATFMINVTAPSQPPPPNPPTSCTLAFQNHGSGFTAPDSASVVATCRNATNAVLPCGHLAWSTTAIGGAMSPSSTTTPPSQPKSTFSITAVSAPQSAQVKAQQGSNFSCTIALDIIAPDYVPLLSAPLQVQVNTAFTAAVTTKNIGAAANISTITRLRFRSTTHNIGVAPLGQQGAQNDSRSFSCPSTPGLYELNATVDATNLLTESNENNNFATQMVNCSQNTTPPILKPNYVPNISAPSVAFIGQAFSANFVTKNIGQAAATVTSTTRTTFQSAVKDFSVAPLSVQQQQTDGWNFNCTSAGVKNLVETVDYFNVINESSENDNTQSKPITCYTAPTSCILNFTGPDFPPFNSYATSGVLASCFAGGVQTACPPFLWQQNANGGSMSPANTPAGLAPSSTLTLTNAPVPQLGRKVNATSTLPGIPLYCEIAFIVSGGAAVGPDYTVTSIQPSPAPADIGQTVHFTTTVANIGNVNATNDSTSVATYSAGCTPVKSSYFLPHINAGASHTDTSLECICNAAGAQTITVEANPAPHPQYETTYTNNLKTITFICNGSTPPLTCAYFV